MLYFFICLVLLAILLITYSPFFRKFKHTPSTFKYKTLIMEDAKVKLIINALYDTIGLSDSELEESLDSLLVIDEKGCIAKVNKSFCKLFGFSKSTLLGSRPPFPFWPKELVEELDIGFRQALKGTISGKFDSIHMDKSGKRFPVSIVISDIKDSRNEILGYFALFKKVELDNGPVSELQHTSGSEEKENGNGHIDLRSLVNDLGNTLDNISDGILQLDRDWCFTYLNEKAGELLNIVPYDLYGKNIWAEFPELKNHSFSKNCYTAVNINKSQVFQGYFELLDRYMYCRFYPSTKGVTIFLSDITEQKLAEKESIKNQEIFKVLMETLTQPLFILSVKDNTYKFLNVSKSFLTTLNISEKEVLNKNVKELIPEPSLTLVLSKYKEAIETKQTVQWEETTQYEAGLKTAIVTVSPLFNNLDYCTHLVGIVFDITERKQAEKLILQKENFLENVLNNISDPIFVKDKDSRLLLVNNAFCTAFHLDRKDIIGKTLAKDVDPEEREDFLKIDWEVLKNGIENINEEPLTERGRETKIISTKKARYIDEQENVYLIGIIRDLTERKKTETELKMAQEYSDILLESLNEGLVVFNMETEIIRVNPSFCKISGFSEEDLIGQQCPYPFSPPEIEDEAVARHQSITNGEELKNFDTVYIKKDGTRFNVRVMISSIKDKNSNGKIVAYFGTVIDTTERKKAELNLKLAKEFTDKLIMSMQEGLIIVDLNGNIILVNDATCKILGYSMDELIGMHLPYPFAKPEDLEEIVRTNKKVAKGEAPSFQFEFIRKNGEAFLCTFLTGNITNDQGEVIALFGSMKDISEEVRSKRLLEENAEKSTRKKDVILELANLVGKDFRKSLDTITQSAAETLNVERVSVWSFNESNSQIKCENLYTKNSKKHDDGAIIKHADNPNYFEALHAKQTILIQDAIKHKATKKFASNYLIPNQIKSLMDVFINSTEGYYGILCFEHVGTTTRNWTVDEQEFASSIANIVSLMVESTERKIAKNKLLSANEELAKANTELNILRNKLEQENIYLRNELDLVFNFEEMVYSSAIFSNVLTEVEKVAPTDATVLLLGESGTGKELLARAVHKISLRNNKPLIKVNCSAIPRELIESELFGHKKGSFTGAINDKVGKFELADGGTLFLDEIGELPLDMQPKLLRFLQEGEIEVIGGTSIKRLDVRVIAATNRILKEEVEKRNFREDLYFRLNVFPIEVPPLRQRKEDIPLLVEHFINKFNKTYKKGLKFVAEGSMKKMKEYKWPGNIRELENLVERAAILSTGEILILPGFESDAQKNKTISREIDETLDSVQKKHILSILDKCNWKITGPKGAATILGLKPSTLRDRMAKLGISKQ